jgi:hypothetical protein
VTDTPAPPQTATGGPEGAREARVGPTQPPGGSETPQTDAEALHRLRAQLAAEQAKACGAHQQARPPLTVTPHDGIVAGLSVALFYLDHHIRHAEQPPRTTANNPLREQYAAVIRVECGIRFEYVTAQLLAIHRRDTAQLRRERDMALKAAAEARAGVGCGPSVDECRDADAAHWNDRYAGEGA